MELKLNNLEQETVVLVSGRFNVVHPGHLRLFRFARECGTKLIVAVESDNSAKNLAHINENLRLDGVKSISYVDEAFLFDGDIIKIIDSLRPNIVVKGREYQDRANSEEIALSKYGGKLLFCSGETSFSSIDLLKFEEKNELHKLDSKTLEFLVRKKINSELLNNYLNRFSALKVCVVGDVIVDEYVACEALGMSQEDPTIVVSEILSEKFLGGAGIVAAHAANLGAEVKFYSVIGEDVSGEFVRDRLYEFNVTPKIFFEYGRPTTTKKRFRCNGKTLLRVSKLHQNSISNEIKEKIFSAIEQDISNCDVLIFSDFNYGCLPQDLVDKILKLARFHKVLIAADSQSSSQIGDIARYKGVTLITPTEREARIALKNREDGLPVLAEMLMEKTNSQYTILKMGAEGLMIFDRQSKVNGGEPLPAQNLNPVDTSGAGDSLLVATAMALAIGATIWESGYMGAIAASIQVSRRGNKPISKNEFASKLELLKFQK